MLFRDGMRARMPELVQGGGLKILCVKSLVGSNPTSSNFLSFFLICVIEIVLFTDVIRARMPELVQGGGLKILCVKSLVGSNPTPSNFSFPLMDLKVLFVFLICYFYFFICFIFRYRIFSSC